MCRVCVCRRVKWINVTALFEGLSRHCQVRGRTCSVCVFVLFGFFLLYCPSQKCSHGKFRSLFPPTAALIGMHDWRRNIPSGAGEGEGGMGRASGQCADVDVNHPCSRPHAHWTCPGEARERTQGQGHRQCPRRPGSSTATTTLQPPPRLPRPPALATAGTTGRRSCLQ